MFLILRENDEIFWKDREHGLEGMDFLEIYGLSCWCWDEGMNCMNFSE